MFDLQRKEQELAQKDDEHATMLALTSASTSAAASAWEEQEQARSCRAQEMLQKQHVEEIQQLETEVVAANFARARGVGRWWFVVE